MLHNAGALSTLTNSHSPQHPECLKWFQQQGSLAPFILMIQTKFGQATIKCGGWDRDRHGGKTLLTSALSTFAWLTWFFASQT